MRGFWFCTEITRKCACFKGDAVIHVYGLWSMLWWSVWHPFRAFRLSDSWKRCRQMASSHCYIYNFREKKKSIKPLCSKAFSVSTTITHLACTRCRACCDGEHQDFLACLWQQFSSAKTSRALSTWAADKCAGISMWALLCERGFCTVNSHCQFTVWCTHTYTHTHTHTHTSVI